MVFLPCQTTARQAGLCLSLFKTFIYLAAPDLSCGMWDLVPCIEPWAPSLGSVES